MHTCKKYAKFFQNVNQWNAENARPDKTGDSKAKKIKVRNCLIKSNIVILAIPFDYS
jgi:hypothetical protein